MKIFYINIFYMLKFINKNTFLFSQFIKLTRLEGNLSTVAKLELNNPKKKNALSFALVDEVNG